MGLFGLIWTLFMTTGKAVNGIKNSIEDSHNKENSLDGIMYYDHKGRRRLISNNHFCHDKYVDGYRRIIDSTNFKVVWDARNQIIPENIEKYKKDALNKGKSVYRCDSHIDNLPYNRAEGEIIGHQYKDFQTERIYIIRVIDNFSFFVDIKTNKAVRYTDFTLNFIEKSNKMIDEKRTTCRTKELGEKMYVYILDDFKRRTNGRNPLEEYNYRTAEKIYKTYYNPKESGGYNNSYERLEERFNCKEGKLDED